MRLTINRDKIQEGLSAITGLIASKTTLPVLGNVLLEGTDRGLEIAGTDLDIGARITLAADVEDKGGITIPARKLADIVKELPSAAVQLATSGEQRLNLECNRTRFKLLGLPRHEFPSFPGINFDDEWQLRVSELQKLILHTSFAVSIEESRPILNGVLWDVQPDSLRMVATNGHRLAKMELPGKAGGKSIGKFIIPPKALDQIRKLFPSGEDVMIGHAENHIGFRSPFVSLYSRLIEGPYPPYESVLPKDNDKTALVDKTTFTSALRRMAVIASDQTHRVKLSFNTAILRLSVQTPDLGEGQDEIAVTYRGDPIEIGFNGQYLLDVLRFIPTDEVKVTFKHAEKAVTLEPENWDDPAKYICLVMPLRLVD